MNRGDASKFSNSGPILVVGRLWASPKGIADHVLEGSTHLRITETLQAQQLSKQPYDVRRAKGIEIMRKLGIIK